MVCQETNGIILEVAMFFYISKIFSFFLSPLTWIIVLLFLGAFFKNPKKSKRFLIASFILLLIFSNSLILQEILRKWEIPATPAEEIKQEYAAGIVLGGGIVTRDANIDRLAFRDNTDRLLQAIWLYQTGKIEKIILSGGSGRLVYRDMREASMMRKYLIETGPPEKDIYCDSLSDNTHQNALYTSEIVRDHFAGKPLLLITSGLHMRRALSCFRKEKMQLVPFSTNNITGVRRIGLDMVLIPRAENIILWQNFIHELAGYGMYMIMGYATSSSEVTEDKAGK